MGKLEHQNYASCRGVTCHIGDCEKPARHKVGEELFHDERFPHRHNLTAYVCCEHFVWIMGDNQAVRMICPKEPA